MNMHQILLEYVDCICEYFFLHIQDMYIAKQKYIGEKLQTHDESYSRLYFERQCGQL